MESINDSRKIIYVFDATEPKESWNIVSEHVKHYLETCKIYINKGDLLHSDSKKKIDCYQGVFSCQYGEITVKRCGTTGHKYWLLEISDGEEINIYDDGNITFVDKPVCKTNFHESRYLVFIRTMSTKNCTSFSYEKRYHDKMEDETQVSSRSSDVSRAQVNIYWDEFGNIKIELFYKDRNTDFSKTHSILIGNHIYSIEEYFEMLNDSICDEGIPDLEQEWMKALFSDPRLSALLEGLLKKIPASKKEWYTQRARIIAARHSAAMISENNRFNIENTTLQAIHDKKVERIQTIYGRQCTHLENEKEKLETIVGDGSQQDEGRPRLVKVSK